MSAPVTFLLVILNLHSESATMNLSLPFSSLFFFFHYPVSLLFLSLSRLCISLPFVSAAVDTPKKEKGKKLLSPPSLSYINNSHISITSYYCTRAISVLLLHQKQKTKPSQSFLSLRRQTTTTSTIQ